MKYKVLRTFRDKYTKVVHEEGAIYPTEDQERASFLQQEGFIKAVEPPKKPVSSKKNKKVAEDEKSSQI